MSQRFCIHLEAIVAEKLAKIYQSGSVSPNNNYNNKINIFIYFIIYKQ